MSEETCAQRAARLRVPQHEIAKALKASPSDVCRAMDDDMQLRIWEYLDRVEAEYQTGTRNAEGESP